MNIIGVSITTILEIVKQGMVAWNEHSRTKFKRKYHTILSKLDEAQNKTIDYTDAEIDILQDQLEIFLKAFAHEASINNKPTGD